MLSPVRVDRGDELMSPVVDSSGNDHIPQMKRDAGRRSLVSKAAPPVMESKCASMIRGPAIRNRQSILAYAAILGTCTAGILHFSWWAFVAGACVLALISISNHSIAGRGLGATESAVGVLLFSSLLNATVTSAAALAIGRGIAWVWGV